jgi:hypothetical protein
MSWILFPISILDFLTDLILLAILRLLGLIEISTRNPPGCIGWLVLKADNLPTICKQDCLESVGLSTFHSSLSLQGMKQERFAFSLPLRSRNASPTPRRAVAAGIF